ncbi:MAG TPA: DUF4082 domain-containing protein, partial [Thermoanaerobaculia bacterium]|nr:DUF4082 domain-containing protein [Thermoanaerobaculia bacterium]
PGRTSGQFGALPAFFQLGGTAETDARNFAQDSIATANAIFTNSAVDARYGFLGMVPLLDPVERGGEPATGLEDVLAWLTGGAGNNPARGPEAAALRDAYGADIVAAIIPAGWNETPYCGVANLPQTGRFITAFDQTIFEDMGDRAFSATRSGCGALDFTVPHEIGHNHGLMHDRYAANDLFPNGRGYIFQDGGGVYRATVMGCACRGTFGADANLPYPVCSNAIFGAVCNRVPYYSDPGIIHPTYGVALGDATHQEAQAMRSRVWTTSSFRTRSTNFAPYARLTVTCSALTCTFSASGSSDDTYIAEYYWDFGDGTFARGWNSSVTHPYSSANSYRAHLVVTDSGGQRTVTTATASPWNPAYEGWVDHINCRSIDGWAYDAVVPNTPINVDLYRNGSKVATVPANIYRSDLVAAGKGNGVHGFVYAPSSVWKTGTWNTASVRFGGSNTDLGYLASRTFICNVDMFRSGTPADNLSTGGQVYSVGTQFRSTNDGYITRLGFYRAAGETGTNTLRLATDWGGTMASKSASCSWEGWCWVTLDQPVFIYANTSYRVWVNTNTQQAKTGCGIGGGISNGPLTAQSGYWVAGNTFPTNGSCSNFWVDVKFDQ